MLTSLSAESSASATVNLPSMMLAAQTLTRDLSKGRKRILAASGRSLSPGGQGQPRRTRPFSAPAGAATHRQSPAFASRASARSPQQQRPTTAGVLCPRHGQPQARPESPLPGARRGGQSPQSPQTQFRATWLSDAPAQGHSPGSVSGGGSPGQQAAPSPKSARARFATHASESRVATPISHQVSPPVKHSRGKTPAVQGSPAGVSGGAESGSSPSRSDAKLTRALVFRVSAFDEIMDSVSDSAVRAQFPRCNQRAVCSRNVHWALPLGLSALPRIAIACEGSLWSMFPRIAPVVAEAASRKPEGAHAAGACRGERETRCRRHSNALPATHPDALPAQLSPSLSPLVSLCLLLCAVAEDANERPCAPRLDSRHTPGGACGR